MKKIILSLFVAGALSMNAQDAVGYSKGNIALTTGLGYNTNTLSSGTKVTGFNFTPEVMYMLKSNWGLSGMINYSSTKNELAGVSTTASDFGIGAGIKHFFTPANALSFYLGGNAMVNFGDAAAGGVKGTQFSLGFNPGFTYFIHKNWTLGADLNLASLKINAPETGDGSTNFAVNNFTSITAFNFKLAYVIK